MNSLDTNIETGLQKAFQAHNFQLSNNDIIFTVEGSANESQEKILKIIRDVGFCPIFSKNPNAQGNFIFTVVPHDFPQTSETEVEIKEKVQSSESRNVCSVLSKKAIKIYEQGNFNLIEFATYDYNRESYSEHYERHRKNILSHSQGLTNNALILGFGNGSDIPLKELAEQFEKITVVDVDMSAMTRAIVRLPATLQRKVTPIQKDLTGLLGPLSKKIEKLSARLPQRNCIAQINKIFAESLRDAEKISFEKHQLVVSSMLCSQLTTEVNDYMEHTISEKYNNISNNDLRNSLSGTLLKILKFTIERHFTHLSEWVQPQGKVYFADNTHIDLIQMEWVPKNGNVEPETNVRRTAPTGQTLVMSVLEKQINTFFTEIQEKQKWFWTHFYNEVKEEFGKKVKSGKAHHVKAFFLKPKRT